MNCLLLHLHQQFRLEPSDKTLWPPKVIWLQDVIVLSSIHNRFRLTLLERFKHWDFRLKDRAAAIILSVDLLQTLCKWVQIQVTNLVTITFLTLVILNQIAQILPIIMHSTTKIMQDNVHRVLTKGYKMSLINKTNKMLTQVTKIINPLDPLVRHQISTIRFIIRLKEIQVCIKFQNLAQLMTKMCLLLVIRI